MWRFPWIRRNQLYSTTTISGFSFINESKTRKEVLFWYIIIIGFAAFTIFNLSHSVTNYLSKPTVTKVKISSAEHDFLPPIAFVLGVSIFELADGVPNTIDYPRHRYLSEWQEKIYKKQRMISENFTIDYILQLWQLGDDLSSDDDEDDQFLSSLSDWRRELYSCSQAMLDPWKLFNMSRYLPYIKKYCKYYEEGMKMAGFIPTEKEILLNIILRLHTLQEELYGFPQKNKQLFYEDNYEAQVERLGHLHIGKALVKETRLNQSMASIITKLSNKLREFLVVGHVEFNGLELVEFNGHFILGGIFLSTFGNVMKLKFYPKSYNSSKTFPDKQLYQTYRSYDSTFQFEKQLEEGENRVDKYYTSDSVYMYMEKIDFDGFISKSDRHDVQPRDISTTLGEGLVSDYYIQGRHIQKFNKSCKQSIEAEQYECYYKCKADVFVSLCNCVPWSLNAIVDSSMAVCYDARSCFESHRKRMTSAFKDCEIDCTSCEEILWRVENRKMTRDKNLMQLEIYMNKGTVYPVFEEHYSYDLSTFLAEIGGQMDLWIGCSVIGILHIIVFFIKRTYEYATTIRKPTNKVKNEINDTLTTVSPHTEIKTANSSSSTLRSKNRPTIDYQLNQVKLQLRRHEREMKQYERETKRMKNFFVEQQQAQHEFFIKMLRNFEDKGK